MSLKVKHLNGDSTFLLTFALNHPYSDSLLSGRETFTVLVDPWLTGESIIHHRLFALARRTVPSCIKHLSEILPPDVIIISQDKTDHCHEETLRQLDPLLPHTIILAHPSAAKKILSWKYFNPAKVHALPVYSEADRRSIVRFNIGPSTPGVSNGEATFALIPSKRDITGLHNAIGITFRAPCLSSSSPFDSQFPSYNAGGNHFTFNVPAHPSPRQATFPGTPPPTPPDDSCSNSVSSAAPSIFDSSSPGPGSPNLSMISPPTSPLHAPIRSRTISVLYSPHGVAYEAIKPYVTKHLVTNAALPLTLLLHSFDRVQNPWYLGGNISAGMPGGLEIAQNLLARCWISAHDEEKENSGISIIKVVTRKHTVEEVRKFMERDRKGGKVQVDIRALECGEEMTLSSGHMPRVFDLRTGRQRPVSMAADGRDLWRR